MDPGFLKDLLEGKRYPTDLILVMAFSTISALGIFLSGENSILKIVLGIPLLIFLPGYALVSVLWPGRKRKTPGSDDRGFLNIREGGIENLERLMLSIGLSIVLVPIIGLILNYVSSISLAPILFSLLTFTIVCSLIAWYLRKSIPASERYHITFTFGQKSILGQGSFAEKAFTLILAASVIISMSVLLYMIVNPADSGPYTEFYLLDQNQMLENLPKNLTVNETASIFIDIVNHENDIVNYTLISTVNNSSPATVYVPVSSLIGISMNHSTTIDISLGHSERFEQEYGFQFTEPGRYRIVWELLIDGQETDYQIHLWVNVS